MRRQTNRQAKGISKIWWVGLLLGAIIGTAIGYYYLYGENAEKPSLIENPHEEKSSERASQPTELPQEEQSRTVYIEGQELPTEPTYIQGILLANKQHPLPSTFNPGESSEAREAFTQLAAASKIQGHELVAFSTFRAYDYQVDLYKRYVEKDGVEEADRYSARPGYSEHQTGLAFDIGEVGKEVDFASNRFGQTEAGKWLAENAHIYGFIMRYPEGKEEITGYMHESWHFRYVGVAIATEIKNREWTLEEYLER